VAFVVFWLLCSILGAAMLSRYNKAGTGFLLGLILGPLGLLFVLVIRSGENKRIEQARHEEQIQALKGAAIEPATKPGANAHREERAKGSGLAISHSLAVGKSQGVRSCNIAFTCR
jgi:hypothetical protein